MLLSGQRLWQNHNHKLIAGLYDNYSGEILLNGKNLREWDSAELKAMLSIVNQDFAKYYITVRDNIALGDVNHIGDSDWRVNRAIDQVGLAAAVEKLPQGIHTPLGKIKADGQDVSGGEWQRIAMARAIANPAPLRILDEPQPPSILSVKVSYTKSSSGSAAARPRSLSATALGPPNWRMKSL